MTALPAVINNLSNADLAILAGTKNESSAYLATLRINYLKKKDDVKLPRGIWALFNGEEEVYGKDLTTKIMAASYQVREYDAEAEEYVGETIFFSNGGDREPEDDQGGYRCGKMFWKDVKDAPKTIKDEQRQKKFYRVIWGLATLNGKNAGKKTAKAENIPFIMRLRGNSFKPICDYLDSFKEGDSFNHMTNWRIEEGEEGTVDYWIVHPELGVESVMTQSPDEMATFRGLLEWRNEANDSVMRKWRKKNGLSAIKVTAVEIDAVVIDETDLDDEIPF